MEPVPSRNSRELAGPVAVLSAAVLGFEISLMRMLLAASWHHFASVVISAALLGFGSSGTVLSILRPRLLRRWSFALFTLSLGTALAMPLCAAVAQWVPVEARFVPALLWRQIGLWILYWALLGTPFLLGAAAIGLALMAAGERVATVYAANLTGSGVGALLAPLAMVQLPPEWLPVAWGALALLAAAGVGRIAPPIRWWGLALSALTMGAFLTAEPPRIRADPYKRLSQIRSLERDGDAERAAAAYGPRGVVEIYRGDIFHDIPFLSPDAQEVQPPVVYPLLIDGHQAGAVLRVREPEDAAVAERTLMSFAYELLSPGARVLLLGERGGLNVWLAARKGAQRVEVVQPNGHVFSLVRKSLRHVGGEVLDLPRVRTVVSDPRLYVERTGEEYELIQLVQLESSAAGSGGVGGLGQDFLTTVEGLAACLDRLTPEGLLCVCRGIQTPPRDNVKLLATLTAALALKGIEKPAEHVVIVRDYLAVSTIAKPTPWKPEQRALVRERLLDRDLTPVWFQGLRPEELNQPDELPGPPGAAGDWYHHAAKELFSPNADRFIDDWVFDVRPATDDRPFFLDFCRLRSIAPLKDAFGPVWLTRAEIAFLFVLGATAVIGVFGAALTLFPLLVVADVRRRPGKGATALYFAAIGLAYLLLEMTVLSRLTLMIGDPVSAAAVTLAAFLILSGAGSLMAQRIPAERETRILWIMVALAFTAAAEILLLDDLARAGGTLPLAVRCALAILAVAPLPFLMGFPMPTALGRLHRGAGALVPWAWGVNGFASVLAAPLATALAMTWGFRLVGAAAVILYLAAAWMFSRLPGGESAPGSRVG